MKRQLGWQRVTREALAAHLKGTDILAAEAIGDTSVYRCLGGSGESIAISLPGDQGLIVQLSRKRDPALERRRSGSNSPLDE